MSTGYSVYPLDILDIQSEKTLHVYITVENISYPVSWSMHPVCKQPVQAKTLALQFDLSDPNRAADWHLQKTQTFMLSISSSEQEIQKNKQTQHILHFLLRSCRFRLMLMLMSFISMYLRLVSLFMFSSKR